MRSFLALVVLLFSGSAMAITIDFEHPITQLDLDEGGYPLRLQTQGFEFTTDEAHWLGGSVVSYCPWCSATVNTISGDAFSLSSIDLASVYPNDVPDAITVTGNYVGGGQISTTLNLTSTFATFNLGVGWNNLQSVDFGASSVFSEGGLAAPSFSRALSSGVF